MDTLDVKCNISLLKQVLSSVIKTGSKATQ